MTVTYLPLADPVRKHGWRDRALCAQIGGDIWFPEKGGDSGVAAKRVCRACPVTAECLAYALEMGEEHGVWGGMSPHSAAVSMASRCGTNAAPTARSIAGIAGRRSRSASSARTRRWKTACRSIAGRAGNAGTSGRGKRRERHADPRALPGAGRVSDCGRMEDHPVRVGAPEMVPA